MNFKVTQKTCRTIRHSLHTAGKAWKIVHSVKVFSLNFLFFHRDWSELFTRKCEHSIKKLITKASDCFSSNFRWLVCVRSVFSPLFWVKCRQSGFDCDRNTIACSVQPVSWRESKAPLNAPNLGSPLIKNFAMEMGFATTLVTSPRKCC